MKLHKFIITYLVAPIFLFIATPVCSVPMSPYIFDYKQSGNTHLKIRAWGDENLNGWETIDNYTILKNSNAEWVYAVKSKDGTLLESILPADNNSRPVIIKGQEIAKQLRPNIAFSIPIKLEQPDGSQFMAKRWSFDNGRSDHNGWETVHGYTIVRDENSYWKYAARLSSGKLALSNTVVFNNDLSPKYEDGSIIVKHLRPLSVKTRSSRSPQSPAFNSIGTVNVPVILARWADGATPDHSKSFLNEHYFGAGPKTLNTYYDEVSYGKFNLTGVMSDWVQLPNNHDYYGHDITDYNDYYRIKFMEDAVSLVDAQINFGNFDSNSDCFVDGTIFLYQGDLSNNGYDSNDLGAQSWDIASAFTKGYPSTFGPYIPTNDDCPSDPSIKMKIDDYVFAPELGIDKTINIPPFSPIRIVDLAGVGIVGHEVGHLLGLPELYDPGTDSFGIGDWGIMGTGSWLGLDEDIGQIFVGHTPPHFTAWSKYILGWVSPIPVTKSLQNISILPASNYDSVYMIGQGNPTNNTSEYYLIENRQQRGFDTELRGSGLAIWHIDQAKTATGNNLQCVPTEADCSTSHYLVALAQADGLWELEKNITYQVYNESLAANGASDPYNYYKGNPGDLYIQGDTFTVNTNPSALYYDSESIGFSIENIISNSGVMTVDFISDTASVCDGDTSEIIGHLFVSNTTTTCTGSISITAGENTITNTPTIIENGATVTIISPVVKLMTGVQVNSGANLEIRNQ